MEKFGKREFEELRKQIEPIKKLALHDDADGVTSAVLLSFVFKINRVWAPEDFGEWPITPYKIEGKGEFEMPPDVCVDMIPANPNWDGLAIDHHPRHLPEGQRTYRLIHGEVPTGILIYLLFKDWIPKEQKWKVAISGIGDGQPELIPPEIWRENPILLEETVSVWKDWKKVGFQTSKPIPIYYRLSSGINAACKIPEKWYLAYSVLRNAKTPLDLLNDPSLKTAKEMIKEEKEKVLKETIPLQLRNGLRFWVFDSETKIERTLAYEMAQKDLQTTIVLNKKTGRGSIRGTLATLVYEHLSQNGFKSSGHAGFGGIRLSSSQTHEDLYKCLTSLKI